MLNSTPEVTLASYGQNEFGKIKYHVATFYVDGVKHERRSYNQDEGSNGFYWAELMVTNIENILSSWSAASALAAINSRSTGLSGYVGIKNY